MKRQNSSLLREALMGALGGIGAAYLMGFIMEKGPKSHEEPATVKAAESVVHMVTDKEIPENKKPMAGQAVHYMTGATLGAMYGVGRALLGGQKPWYMGPLYGMGVWLVLDEVLVPALRLSAPPQKHSLSTHVTALGAHLAYGALVDTALTAEEKALHQIH